VITSQVRKNQSLSDILSSYGVGFTAIHELAQLSLLKFDVRKIRAGNEYTLITANEYPHEPLYFIYKENPADYIVFRLKDTLQVTRGSKPIEKRIRTVGGVIESSLWNSLKENGSDPNLANELSEVYAWTIDFFGIQKGDFYQVIFEELSVEGEMIGFGKVLAANFHNLDKDNFSFWFIQNNEGDYFDDQGQSLRRAFLKAPLKFKRISSRFTHSRLHPVLKIRRPHLGVDYAADAGTPVQTIGDGSVIEKAYDKKGGGNYVKIKHNSTYTTVYMHLQGFARGLRTGSRVRQGDVIGYVGSTGLATGPHLDFRVYRNGQPIDPLKMESPPAKPVDPLNLAEFNVLKDSLIIEVRKVPVIGFSDPVSRNR
jgi:murein DD-endopeptidase MepM/ murein hydrolase activator NlpD